MRLTELFDKPKRHIIITLPSSNSWEDYQKELDTVSDGSEVMRFKVGNFPKEASEGSKCYVCHKGHIVGWMPVTGFHEGDFTCSTTGRQWSGKFIERSGQFNLINPIPYKGFQGWRYFEEPSMNESRIDELFNKSNIPWKTTIQKSRHKQFVFNIDKVVYEVNLKFLLNSWTVDFGIRNEYDEVDIELSNLNNEYKVFSTVIDIISNFIKNENPNGINFSGYLPKRRRLYAKMIRVLVKRLPDYRIHTEYEHDGQYEIVKKTINENEVGGTFVGIKFTKESQHQLYKWMVDNIPKCMDEDMLHVTIIVDKTKPLDWKSKKYDPPIEIDPDTYRWELFDDNKDVLVLRFDSPELQDRYEWGKKEFKVKPKYPEYKPHVSMSYDKITSFDGLPLPKFPLYLEQEYTEPTKKKISEKYYHGFKPSYTKEQCDVYINPNSKEWKHISKNNFDARVWLVGNNLLAWETVTALHYTVREELGFDKESIPGIIYGSIGRRGADFMVTDAVRHGKWFHNPDVVKAIKSHPYIQKNFPDINVSFYDENIYGAWDSPDFERDIEESEEVLKLPDIETGDEVMVGKFKNRKATVKGFKKDDHNQPVLKTNKGDQKLFKPRLKKLEIEEARHNKRLLYHGTLAKFKPNIQQLGLYPTLGEFTQFAYQEHLDMGIELDDYVFAADRKGLFRCISAMGYAIKSHYPKFKGNVYSEGAIKKYGMICVIHTMAHRFEYNDQTDIDAESDYRSHVEPDDYFADTNIKVDKFLTGDELINFLRKRIRW